MNFKIPLSTIALLFTINAVAESRGDFSHRFDSGVARKNTTTHLTTVDERETSPSSASSDQDLSRRLQEHTIFFPDKI